MSLPPKQRVSPLNWREPIVNSDGTPSQQFIRLWQTMFGNGENTSSELQQLVDAQLQAGSGIAITPDGHLLSNPTIAAEVQPILDQITDVHGSILYRDSTGWAHLPPGTSGDFLQTQGAGADPLWATAGGAGSAWALFATTTISSPVSSIPFTGLAGYSNVLVYCSGVVCSVSGVAVLQVSTNNGSTYYSTSGDYLAIDAAGTVINATGASFWSTNSTAARYGTVTIEGINVTGAPRILKSFPSTSTPLRPFVADNANDIDAIRLIPSAGGNFTAGTVYVYVS